MACVGQIARTLLVAAMVGSLSTACSSDSTDQTPSGGGSGGSGASGGSSPTGGSGGTGGLGGTGGGGGSGATGGSGGVGGSGGSSGSSGAAGTGGGSGVAGTGGTTTGGTGGEGGSSGASGSAGTAGSAGASGSSGAAGSGGTGGIGDPFEATVTPSVVGSIYSLTMGNVVFEVDANAAGKIVTFQIDDTDMLVDSAIYTGSVFWPSPQSLFPGGWPPPEEWDIDPFTVTPDTGNVIEMVGEPWPQHNIGVTKRFWANGATGVVTIEYTIRNEGSSPMSVAPWEVTRVYTGGLTFLPETIWTHLVWGNNPIPLTSAHDAAWFAYTDAAINGAPKSGIDASSGWAAHVHCGPGLQRACTGDSPILIKQFENVEPADFAPGESDLEIFADSARTYVEFEVQGPYTPIPANDSLVWIMRWYLRYVPSNIDPLNESQALLDWAASQLY